MTTRGYRRSMFRTWLRVLLVPTLLCTTASANAQLLVPQKIDNLLTRMDASAKIAQISARTLYDTADNDSLSVPGMKMLDGPHGIHAQGCTSFPTGIAVAATWDRQTAWDVGLAMAEEFWSHGEHIGLAPCIDISLDPRGGRTAESAGEDPYISGQTGAWFIRGFQQTPVMACLKHFEIEGKQAYRTTCNELIAERDLMEHFGYNFRTAIQEGLPLSLMSSYNLVNDIQGNENRHLQTTILRSRWGFPFFVMSDWIAVKDGDRALKAGTDLCMGSTHFRSQLPRDLANGVISEADLDTAARRILLSKYASGMMDYRPAPPYSLIDTEEHRTVCRDAARKSIILLRNDNAGAAGKPLLPIAGGMKVALIGPNAEATNLNCYGSSETFPSYATSILEGMRSKSSRVTFTQGCTIDAAINGGKEQALKAAREADVVVFAGGIDKSIEGELIANMKVNDRQTTALPAAQQQLINDIAEVNQNIIVVLQSGGILSMPECISAIPALIYAPYGGQEAGNAIADVIFGDYNPAGRLPATMPVSDEQLPEWNDTYYTDDFGTGYRWFDRMGLKPQFAFGHGLSYTTFEYSNLRISALGSDNNCESFTAGAPVTISVDVKNTGLREGEEVAQLYLSNHITDHYVPVKELRGYERISLQPGESASVQFQLNAEDFYYWNTESNAYEVTPARYTVAVGGASDSLPLSSDFVLASGQAHPDLKATGVFTQPRYPRTGDQVTFYAYVKNQGNAPLKATDTWKMLWTIDGKEVASARISGSDRAATPTNDTLLPFAGTLAPGEGTMIYATVNNWQPGYADQYLLSVQVNPDKALQEWRTDNNGCSALLEVADNPLWDAVSVPSETRTDARTAVRTYDLSGREIRQKQQKGIYIQKGRKIVVR